MILITAKHNRTVPLTCYDDSGRHFQNHRPLILMALCFALELLASSRVARVMAQSADNGSSWQAMRVYVPEDQVDSVVPRDYLTIDVDDLEQLLAEESRRRAQSAVQATGIQRATYVARWNDQLLSSQCSKWDVSLPSNNQPLSIGRTSLAIEDSVLAPVGGESLTRHLRYVDDTRLNLVGSTSDQALWFGFKAKSRRGDAGKQSIDLIVPRAALATLLISVPANGIVQSNLPCARTESPSEFLPSQWPESALTTNADEHWFVVHLSGRELCTLNYIPPPKADQLPYRGSVASAQCDMIVQPSGLRSSCRFQFTDTPASRTVRLRVEEPLHVRSIQVNGVDTLRWRSISEAQTAHGLPDSRANANSKAGPPTDSPDARPGSTVGTPTVLVADTAANTTIDAAANTADDATANSSSIAASNSFNGASNSRLIEVVLNADQQGPVLLNVEAIARMPHPFTGVLPHVEVADAFVLDGRGSLTGSENIQVEDLQSPAQELTTTDVGGYALWRWQWTGRTPVLSTRVRTSANQWSVRSLTRFSIQTNVIVATARLAVSSAAVRGNQVALKLAPGWFIDSAELENAPPGVTTDLRESDGQGSELLIRWEDRRGDIEVHIAINAHYPQRTEVDSLRIQSTRIASLPGADQQDAYVVESSGRFQMEIDPELLRMRIGEEELLGWQRELLPRLADVWIFRGARSTGPPIRLRRVRSTLAAKLSTIVTRKGDNETVVTYRVQCQPISGSIDQLRLMLPIPSDAVALTWSLAGSEASNPRGLIVNSRATSSSTGETSFIIQLSQDMAEPFQLESELRLSGPDNLAAIPLPSIPQAVTQDAVVVVPAALTLPDGIVGLEILPTGMCCTDGNLIEAPKLIASEITVARYDPNVISHLRLSPPSQATHGAWIRQAMHEHWYHTGAYTLHRTAWLVALPSSQMFEFTLPIDWQFETISIDGQQVDAIERTDGHYRIRLSEGSFVRVQLDCSSPTQNPSFGQVEFDEPQSGLPVLNTRRVSWFPGTVMACQSFPRVYAGTWSDRLLPSSWWQWLSLDPWQAIVQSRSSALELPSTFEAAPVLDSHPVLASLSNSQPLRGNWWPLELDSQPGRDHIWHAERSLVSSALLAFVLLLGAVIFAACGSSVSRWWLTISAGAIALCALPESLLLPAQLFALAATGALLVRGCFIIMHRSRPLPRTKDRESHAGSLIALPRSASPVLLCILASGMSLAAGALPSAANAQPLSAGDARGREEIFGILIPVDSDFQMAGDYVYVPTRLSRLLSSSAQQNAESQSVVVQAAFYSLRVSNDPVTLKSSVGELTVELTIQGMQTDAQLTLPLSGRELQLQRAFLDSQEIFEGQRLKLGEEGLTYRATDADRHMLRMVFKPKLVSEKDGRDVLSIAIPAIPTAKLEVMGDDLRDVTVDAIGGMQLESPRFLTAQLGPANRLVISWPTTLNRSTAVQVQSDTWIHSRGDHVMAQCQLRVRGAAALPNLLRVVGDANWQPVGQDWEDGRLVSTDGNSTAGRPVYSVQRSTEANSDLMTIRVLLLPRSDVSPQSLSVPFLALQEAASLQRTLAISQGDTTIWKTVGTETWQPLPTAQAAALWDKSRLAEQPTLLRVPTGSVLATLQHSTPPTVAAADEVTEISLQIPEIKMKYTARWAQSVSNVSAIRLHLPSTLRVDEAFIDAMPARHTMHTLANQSGVGTNEVIVFLDSSRGSMQSVILQLSSPTRLNRPMRLPRPLLLNTKIGTSTIQIFRGAELSSDVRLVDNADIRLERAEVRPSPLLLNLHTMIGQAELGDRFRDSVELPIEVRLSRPTTNRNARAVVQLMRSDQGWTAQITADIEAPLNEVNPVFLDLPSGLASAFREPLDANVPMMLWPAADTNRAIVCVLPQLTTDGQSHISIKIRLPSAGASQSITVPDIRLLGLAIQRPVLALPRTIAGEEVRWSQVGRAYSESGVETLGLQSLDLSDYVLHEPSVSQFQAMWHSRQTEDQNARVLLTRVFVNPDARMHGQGSSGEIRYWIEPRNQAYVSVKLPPQCSLVGAQLGSETMTWTATNDRTMRILLQPSYLPVQLKLFVRWTTVGQDASTNAPLSLTLPELDARSLGDVLVGLPSEGPSSRFQLTAQSQGTELSYAQAKQLVAKAWVNTLVQAAPTAADRQSSELVGWLPIWNPQRLELDSVAVSTPKQFLPSDPTLILATTGLEGVVESNVFWTEYARILGVDAAALPRHIGSETVLSVNDGNEALKWFRIDSISADHPLALQSEALAITRDAMPQWLLAAAVALGSFLVWSLPWGWLRTRALAWSECVWPLWLVMALATWSLLPISWPSAILVLGAAIVMWRRMREFKRDRQFVLLPRTLR